MAHEVPATVMYLVEFEDIQGQRALCKFNVGFDPNINTSTPNPGWALQLNGAATNVFSNGGIADVVTALAACSNAKVVRAGLQVDMDWAAEPTTEPGNNVFVQTKARLHWEDGHGLAQQISVPAPVNGLFLTGVGMQSIVNPALASSGLIATLMTALQLSGFATRGGGVPYSIFMGGQLVEGKPPRRRRIQSQ